MAGRLNHFERQADFLALGVLVAALVICAMSAHLVWHLGWLPGIWLIVGMTSVWIGVCVFRDRLIRPLRAMVESVDQMRKTRQWKKLPPIPDGELQVVASGFNELVEYVMVQQGRLGEQIGELQQINAELNHLANVKDDFLQTINHQLRTPMTAILEGVQLLKDPESGLLSGEQQSYAVLVHENALRLKELLEEMLDLSMLKSGRRLLHRRVDDLAACLQVVCTAWHERSGQAAIQLKQHSLPKVYMDVRSIEEVLHHLLRNAVRHAPAETTVIVHAEATQDMVSVSVNNQGSLLSADQIKRLFEPFVHLHTPEAPGSQGSGLGLAFCKQVIERHGGSIHVESKEGLGTTVSIKLPVASPQFLLVDACRMAKEEAEVEGGTYGICLVAPAASAFANRHTANMLGEAEQLLRKNTHRGDRFVEIDEKSFAIVAVCDDVGLLMMIRRLRGVLEKSRLPVKIGGALFPLDADQPERLLEVARNRVVNPAMDETAKREG